MTTKQWYRAHLRWAVMVEGKEGLRGWKESVYLFLSEDHDKAFRRALEIGRCHQDEHQEERRWVETRLADIVTLDNLGSNPTEFEIHLGTKNPANTFRLNTGSIRRGLRRRRCSEVKLADPGLRSALNVPSFGRHRAALQPRPASLRTNDVGGQIR